MLSGASTFIDLTGIYISESGITEIHICTYIPKIKMLYGIPVLANAIRRSYANHIILFIVGGQYPT